ncbi:MAG: hypothetical protein WC475_01200 [Candidatus Paceibacterota bacterium]
MKALLLKKIVLTVTMISLIFSGLGGVFTAQKAAAQGASTPGEAVGQALAKGTACFLATKLEVFALGLESKAEKTAEGHANMLLFPEAVPITDLSAPGETAKLETSTALLRAKDCVRDVVVKMILDWVVDQTVLWIQNGGQPRYVTNWDTFLQDAFNVGVGEIINETNLSFLCNPFGLQVRISLLPVPRFSQRISCTLDDIVSNIQNFYDDFRNGSWIAYEQSWWPENNYYGSLYMAMDESIIQGAKAKEAAQNEALAGHGFLSVKQCVERDSAGKCTKEEIVTPGDVVGAVAAKAVTSDIDWAANVKSWTAALVNATINRLIKEGLGAMKTSTEAQTSSADNYNPYGSYDPALTGKIQQRDQIISFYEDFRDYVSAILTNKQTSLSLEQQIVTNLNALKTQNCQPLVTDADIVNAQNEFTRLTNEVADYQTAINEINTGIADANNISSNFRDTEMANLVQKYNDFVIKYESLVDENASGSNTTENSSGNEAQSKQTELSLTHSRLTNCVTTP